MTHPDASASRRVVLDASALLAWILDETGADAVTQLLPVGVTPSSAMVETLYRSQECGTRLTIEQVRRELRNQGLEVVPVRDEDTVRAATLIRDSRRRQLPIGSLSLGDGLCIAVAERLGLPVTGGDQAWAAENLTVQFLPFR